MISVCIIAKNEARVLKDCLLSVLPVASEIILLDTGSVDETISIARTMGCRVYETQWTNDFSAARNQVCSYATKDWILCIDCDERLRNPDQVIHCIQEASKDVGCFILERYNHAVGPDGERYTEIRGNARLFRNNIGIQWMHTVHEEPWSSCLANEKAIVHSSILLDHVMEEIPFEQFLKKQTYYLALLEKAVERAPQQHTWMHLARTYTFYGRWEEARLALEQAQLASGKTTFNTAYIAAYRGIVEMKLGNYEVAKKSILHAFELIPSFSLAWYFFFLFNQEIGNTKEALVAIEKLCLTNSLEKPLVVSDRYFTQEQVNYFIAELLVQNGDLDGASTLLESTPFNSVDSAKNLVLLAKINFISEQIEKSIQYLKKAISLNQNWLEPQEMLQKISGN